MKTILLTAAALLLNPGVPAVRALEPAPVSPPEKCEMCELMMKKKAVANPQVNEQIAELDKLVTEMNGSLGPRKIEAMAAVVTRLVANYEMLAQPRLALPAPPVPPAAPPKEEVHEH
jgi:hypothetical protein